MKRFFAFLFAVVGVGGMFYLAGQTQAQQAGAAAPKAKTASVAVFNVAKVMKEYDRWQYYAKYMNDKRNTATAELTKLSQEIALLQNQGKINQVKTEQEKIAQTLVAKQRELEDKQRVLSQELDDESAKYLRNLFGEIQAAVKAIQETNGYEVVFAYPDAITPEEMTSTVYFDLKLRPPAAMPFLVDPNSDITNMLVKTLNTNFRPPVEAGAGEAEKPKP